MHLKLQFVLSDEERRRIREMVLFYTSLSYFFNFYHLKPSKLPVGKALIVWKSESTLEIAKKICNAFVRSKLPFKQLNSLFPICLNLWVTNCLSEILAAYLVNLFSGLIFLVSSG